MDQPKIPMTLEKWISMCKSFKYGDIIHVFCDDITGNLIKWGSEDNALEDIHGFIDFLHPVHTFRYLGLGRGATVEADPKGTQWHLIDEYRDRVIAGQVRLIVTRHDDLTVNEFENIKSEAERQVGKPYGWGAVIGDGLYDLVRNTFIGKWFRDAKWDYYLWCDRNSPYCSQGVRLQENTIKRFYDELSGTPWQQDTPQKLLEQLLPITDYVIDSFQIAKS